MRRLGTTIFVAALAAVAGLGSGGAATAKAKVAPKVGPPKFVVDLQWHMQWKTSDGDSSVDVGVVNGTFVTGVGNQSTAQYHFANPTGGTFTASAKSVSSCWSYELAGSGALLGQLETMTNTAVRFFTYKGARLGVLQFPVGQIAVPVTVLTPGCSNTVDRSPFKVGDHQGADLAIPVPVLRCDGLPMVNQGGDTAFPGGVLSAKSPWTFKINCTTPGTSNADGSTTTGTVAGTVSYTGPTPLLRSWVTAG